MSVRIYIIKVHGKEVSGDSCSGKCVIFTIGGLQICNGKYRELAFREDIKLSRHVPRHLEIILYANLETDVELLESLHRS